MEKKPSEGTSSPTNLLAALTKAKAKRLAQKEGNAFGHFSKGSSRPRDAAKPAFFGGRNGQGKP
jgi:hypothetical protein